MRKLLVILLVLVLSLILVGTILAQDDTPAKPHLGIRAMTTGEGVVVERVVEGSPAAEAGVLVDDVLLSVDDQAITSAADLSAIIAEHAAGDVISLTLRRDDTEMTIEITLAERVSQRAATAEKDSDPVSMAHKLLHVELTASDEGYEVVELDDHSHENNLLAVGDIITAVNGTPVAEVDWQTLRSELAGSDAAVLTLTVLHAGEEITIEIEYAGGMHDKDRPDHDSPSHPQPHRSHPDSHHSSDII